MGKLRNLRNFMSITLLYYSYHVLNFKIINEYFFFQFLLSHCYEVLHMLDTDLS